MEMLEVGRTGWVNNFKEYLKQGSDEGKIGTKSRQKGDLPHVPPTSTEYSFRIVQTDLSDLKRSRKIAEFPVLNSPEGRDFLPLQIRALLVHAPVVVAHAYALRVCSSEANVAKILIKSIVQNS